MKEWKEAMDENAQGVGLAQLIAQQWHVGVADGIPFSEGMRAAKLMGVSGESLYGAIDALNHERGLGTPSDSVIECGFIPQENVGRVRDLLDEIQSLCVCF